MKIKKNKMIDARTDELIQAFSFDGQSFSLSVAAQVNWIGLVVMKDALTWPAYCPIFYNLNKKHHH